MCDYATWYEFKKDLEKESGRRLLNSDWLSVKPAQALPWDRSLLRSSLETLSHLDRGHGVPELEFKREPHPRL